MLTEDDKTVNKVRTLRFTEEILIGKTWKKIRQKIVRKPIESLADRIHFVDSSEFFNVEKDEDHRGNKQK